MIQIFSTFFVAFIPLQVTWVEHVEVDNRLVHPIFQPIVSSGFAFGAKRWLAMLNRHCHWNAALVDRTIPQDPGGKFPTNCLSQSLIMICAQRNLMKISL